MTTIGASGIESGKGEQEQLYRKLEETIVAIAKGERKYKSLDEGEDVTLLSTSIIAEVNAAILPLINHNKSPMEIQTAFAVNIKEPFLTQGGSIEEISNILDKLFPPIISEEH